MEHLATPTPLVVPASFDGKHRFRSEKVEFSIGLERYRPVLLAALSKSARLMTPQQRARVLGEAQLPDKPKPTLMEMISDDDKKRLALSLAKKFTVGSVCILRSAVCQHVCTLNL